LVSPSHHPDLYALGKSLGRVFTRVCLVVNARLDGDLVDQGLGIALYTRLAQIAAHRYEYPIVSSAMMGRPISPEAERVWKSRRLGQLLTVNGLCAFAHESIMQTEPSSAVPTPEAMTYLRERPKLQKRLRLCLHTAIPWNDAPKSHRQLREHGLVYFGEGGLGEVALATPEGIEAMRMLEAPQ
jgi:hypothetical protein